MTGWILIAAIAIVAGLIGYAIDKKRGAQPPNKRVVLLTVVVGLVIIGIGFAIAVSG